MEKAQKRPCINRTLFTGSFIINMGATNPTTPLPKQINPSGKLKSLIWMGRLYSAIKI